jgi:hypothetical protein
MQKLKQLWRLINWGALIRFFPSIKNAKTLRDSKDAVEALAHGPR